MKRKAEVVANETKSKDEKDANTDVEKGNKSEGSNIVEASYVPPRTGYVEEFWAVKDENKSEGHNINEGCYGPPRIRFGEEFCAYPYGRMHNMDYHQGYMQMPLIANYNCPPWMNLRQDECSHPSVMPQDYGVNYPYRPPGFYNYNNFF
ncbi:hypothetical protein Leryth_013795 [Lithospermum erythrorhizon]|nr:hypothetical protein Leryth_013795 [Lithospermum erythrorhizon]